MEPRAARRPLLTFVSPDPAPGSRHRRRWLMVCLGLTLAVLGARSALAAPAAVVDSACDDALHHRLDVWLGDWRVVGAGGEPVGASRVERLHGGCVVRESWTAAEGRVTGEGISYVDPADHRWKQLWIDSTGTVTRATEVVGDAAAAAGGTLRFAGDSTRLDGAIVASRMAVHPQDGGRLHVVIEHSADGGATWETVFDVTYVPAAAGAPAPVPAPAPKPEAAPTPAPVAPSAPAPETAPPAATETAPVSGNVRASSGVVPEQEVPLEQRNRIFLESPMILELPIGPIESIPEEYSWSSKDTSVYVCEGVSVRRVTLSRNEHGKKVDVRAVAALHGTGYLKHVDIVAELVWHGDVLARAEEDKISVGRSILSQSEGDGLEKRFDLTVDRARFDEAFGDTDDRPVLRLTVTVRD